MADDDPGGELYNFDLELYCIVCDRQIDPTRPSLTAAASSSSASTRRSSALPSPPLVKPPPTSVASSQNPPAPPHPTPSSSKSHHAPPLKRTGSNHSTHSNGGAAGATGPATGSKTGTGLKRNKSTGKLHAAGGHHHHHRRNHSHTNLHALAPMTHAPSHEARGKKVNVVAVGPAAEKASRLADRDKAKARAKEELDASEAFERVSTLYCSEECRKIDEARNELTLSHLGRPDSTSSPALPPTSPGQATPSSDGYDENSPYASMVRRRSSGVSSNGSTAYTLSSFGDRGLSPILSAAPTANPAAHSDSSGYPFPAVSPSSSTPLAPNNAPTGIVSNSSSSSLVSLPSQAQSYQNPAPTLNFSSRRQSRGSHSSGAYSYRPSLMERVHSTDSTDSTPSERAPSRAARSLSITGGFSAGLFGRVRSVDGLSGLGKSDSEGSDREGRQAFSHQPPSALSSLRPMTPLSSMHPVPSPTRSRPPLSGSRYSEPTSSVSPRHPLSVERSASSISTVTEPRSRSRSRRHRASDQARSQSRPPPETDPLIVGSDPPAHPSVGSMPVHRSAGFAVGSPTTSRSHLSPNPADAPSGSFANRRSSSSASLSLLASTSYSRSYDHRHGGSGFLGGGAAPKAGATVAGSGTGAPPRRSDSTAELSGFFAMGEMSTHRTGGELGNGDDIGSSFASGRGGGRNGGGGGGGGGAFRTQMGFVPSSSSSSTTSTLVPAHQPSLSSLHHSASSTKPRPPHRTTDRPDPAQDGTGSGPREPNAAVSPRLDEAPSPNGSTSTTNSTTTHSNAYSNTNPSSSVSSFAPSHDGVSTVAPIEVLAVGESAKKGLERSVTERGNGERDGSAGSGQREET
ncbi:hypothetical protein JCM10212_004608 [Sporobolomyces blumeae]